MTNIMVCRNSSVQRMSWTKLLHSVAKDGRVTAVNTYVTIIASRSNFAVDQYSPAIARASCSLWLDQDIPSSSDTSVFGKDCTAFTTKRVGSHQLKEFAIRTCESMSLMSTRHEQHEDHLQSLEGDHLALVAWHPKCCCMLSQPHTSGKQPFSQGGQPDISPAVAIMPSTKVMVCCSIFQKCIPNSTILNVPCVEVARAVTYFDL